ncbi:AAA family ATPase [Candidatus Dependentiae bacterium]|nr:AAA family ATPase [Candidatus Dependentiae bacterium]
MMRITKITLFICATFWCVALQAVQIIDLLEHMNESAYNIVFAAEKDNENDAIEKRDAGKGERFWGGDFLQNEQHSSKTNKKMHTDPVSFKDIVGIESALTEVVEIVNYLKEPRKYHQLGARMPCGILLEGPPGCGKTMIAKAIATEANCYFEQVSASSFIEKYVGVGAARVREFFARARRNKPAIIFIDEFDSIAGVDRSELTGGGGDQESKQTINELLNELDGFSTDHSVIVIAATNNAASLDAAVKRSGRFDRIIHVPLPDERVREVLLLHYLKKLPRLGDDITDQLLNKIAQDSEGLCAADFKNMANEMAIEAVRENSAAVFARHVCLGAEKVIRQRKPSKQSDFAKFLKK